MEGRGDSIWTKLAAVPILALLLGVSILAIRMAFDWTEETTQYVLGGLLTIMGAALGIFALAFGLLAGIAIYRRLQVDSQLQREEQARRGYPLLPAPPTVEGQPGSWHSLGPGSYDIWEEEPEEARWRRGQ